MNRLIHYMFINDMEDKYTVNITEQDDIFIDFHFHSFQDAYYFLTLEYNCLHIDSFYALQQWYEHGICHSCIYSFHKNKQSYIISCISTCISCNDCLYNDIDEYAYFQTNTFYNRTIIISYQYVHEDDTWNVMINIPSICKECVPCNHTSLYKQELLYKVYMNHQHCKYMKASAVNTIYKYPLCEPYILKHILSYSR